MAGFEYNEAIRCSAGCGSIVVGDQASTAILDLIPAPAQHLDRWVDRSTQRPSAEPQRVESDNQPMSLTDNELYVLNALMRAAGRRGHVYGLHQHFTSWPGGSLSKRAIVHALERLHALGCVTKQTAHEPNRRGPARQYYCVANVAGSLALIDAERRRRLRLLDQLITSPSHGHVAYELTFATSFRRDDDDLTPMRVEAESLTEGF